MSNDSALSTIESSEDLERLDFAQLTAWLATSHWSPGISRDKVERGARASTAIIGAYVGTAMVGFARIISDTTRFAYLADVYVAPDWCGLGIARHMVRRLLGHPLIAEVEHCYLLTSDAHGVYAPLALRRMPRRTN